MSVLTSRSLIKTLFSPRWLLVRCTGNLLQFKLTEDDLNQLPKLTFTGSFGVINTPFDEDRYRNELNDIQNAAIVGFDTESLPGSTGPFRPCLIQLSSDNSALLWRVKRRNKDGGHTIWLSSTLVDILTSPKVLKVGHAVSSEDAVMLLKNYHVDMKNFQDTLLIASQLGLGQLSLHKLVAMFLGQKLCKLYRRSNWEKRVLMDQQISYACTDAWASLKVYQSIIRYAEQIGSTHHHHPIERAWNLLKPHDQEVLLRKASWDDLQQGGARSCDGTVDRARYHESPQAMVYEKTVKEERVRVYRRPFKQSKR